MSSCGPNQSLDDFVAALSLANTPAATQIILSTEGIVVFKWNANPGPGMLPKMDAETLPRCGY